jgi:GDPmannose 4,6-dehydratase
VDFVVAIKKGSTGKLSLGSLDTVVDWGAAEDYMSAIYELVKEGKTGDYVISSGHGHTLRQFCEVAFSYQGLDYREHLSRYYENIARVNNTRIGDSSKLISDLGWKPKISFEKMIQNMIDYQMNNLS